VLEHHVVPDRAEVVAQVDDPGRLDAREDPGPLRGRRGRGRRRGGVDGHGSGVYGIGLTVRPSPGAGRYHPRRALPRPPIAVVSLQPPRVGALAPGTSAPE